MQEAKWEQFAREDAEYFIDTTFKGDQEDFFRSGRAFVKQSLKEVLPHLDETERALEIGCGVGRLTFPHVKQFDKVIAVDVAPTMLDKLEKHAEQFGVENIKTCLPNDPWHIQPVDFAYSYLAFQHIPNLDIIQNYIRGIASCLKVDGKGWARLQFDTRPATLFYKCRNRLPDWLLPKTQKKGIRRIRRKPGTLIEIFEHNDLEVVQQQFQDTARHTYLLRKSTLQG